MSRMPDAMGEPQVLAEDEWRQLSRSALYDTIDCWKSGVCHRIYIIDILAGYTSVCSN
jgi:hypothetical protein